MEKLFDDSDLFAERLDETSIALPHPARACFALFADVARWPQWLPVVSKVSGKGRELSLTMVMMKVMLGCRLHFEVGERAMSVEWSSHPSSRFLFRGKVRFEVRDDRHATMFYRVDTAFAPEAGLNVPAPDARSFADCFRAFAREELPMFAEGSAPHVLPTRPPAPRPQAGRAVPPPPPAAALLAVSPRRTAPAGPAASPMSPAMRLAAGAMSRQGERAERNPTGAHWPKSGGAPPSPGNNTVSGRNAPPAIGAQSRAESVPPRLGPTVARPAAPAPFGAPAPAGDSFAQAESKAARLAKLNATLSQPVPRAGALELSDGTLRWLS